MALSDYEETLKSYIHDDDKLVTYKWLSKDLEIHVNAAKDILKQYWEKHRGDEKITATFLLIGQLKDRSIRVEVVKESNLKAAKAKFVKVDCEHLYSLQKSLQDLELLAFAGDGDLRFSAIKCNEEYVRNEEEIEGLRYIGNIKSQENISTGSNSSIKKIPEKQVPKQIVSSKEKPKNAVTETAENKIKNKQVEKEEAAGSKSETKTAGSEKKISPSNKSSNNSKAHGKTAKKPIPSKQSGFNNLFGKASSKPHVTNKSKEDSQDNETETKEAVKVSKASEEEVDKESKEKQKNTIAQEKENKKDQQSENKLKRASKAEKTVDNKSKPKNKNDSRGKKRNRSQEKNVTSKRKRIVVVDESDDEVSKSDEEEEEPMEVEEAPVKVVKKRSPSPPAEKRENGKRMVRKTIDKTYKDEDGYLVTKRIHVYEAASDNEEPVEVQKQEPEKLKKIEVKAKKQATLMSFFKKNT